MQFYRKKSFIDYLSSIKSSRLVSYGSLAVIFLALPITILLVQQTQDVRQHAASSNSVTVDFTSPLRTLSPLAVGMDESGYLTPNVLVNDGLEQQRLKTLGVGYIRMNLQYTVAGDSTSKIVCGGSGCDGRWTGDQWIQTIKSIGAEPVVVVTANAALDAANMVKHFNKDTNNPVKYWIIGNEPDVNGVSVQTYSSYFNADNDAMKAIDPTIKVGGGTTAWYDESYLKQFLQLSGAKLDFVDFHGYPQQGTTPGDIPTLFQRAADYGNNVTSLYNLIQTVIPSRASQIFVEVGEFDLNWGGSAQDNINFHTVWTASSLGHILQAGGYAMYFATKGNLLYWNPQTITDPYGHVVNIKLDDTNPSYHGYGMFTGEGLFPHFGKNMVNTSSLVPNVEAFASDNPKNIVLINKDPANVASIKVNTIGISSGTMDVWTKDESVLFANPPVKQSQAFITNSSFTYQLTPMSVSTFVLSNTMGNQLSTGTSQKTAVISANPNINTVTVGIPFTVDIKVDGGGQAFNAVQANITVSSNLKITGLANPSAGGCNLTYTGTIPSIINPSFAGAILGSSSIGCTVYTLTLQPLSEGTGTVTLSNGSVKAYSDSSELFSSAVNGTYTIIQQVPTATPIPTNGIYPTSTPNPQPTDTPTPTPTLFPILPTNTPVLLPTDTPVPTPIPTVVISGLPTPTPTVINTPVPTSAYLRVPTFDPLPTDTYLTTLTISGSKDPAESTIFVNNSSAQVTYPTDTTWQLNAQLNLDNNILTAYGKDTNGNQSGSNSVTIKVHRLGDINGDGVVDLTDLSIFAVDWLKTSNFTNPLSDINGDGIVDLTDLSILAKYYGQ